jgi:hypothetical protein
LADALEAKYEGIATRIVLYSAICDRESFEAMRRRGAIDVRTA